MSSLRIVGHAGLALLSLAGLLHMYLSVSKGDWYGVAFGIGALVLFAFLGNQLWLAGFRRQRPHVTAVPNRTILGLLFALLGAFTGVTGVEQFMSSNWLAAALSLAIAILLFERASRVLLKRT
jgi:Flp pilus assembly protein protease CpaA